MGFPGANPGFGWWGLSTADELYDRDGDLWWRDAGTEGWYLLGDYLMPRSLAEIDARFGPMTKVDV